VFPALVRGEEPRENMGVAGCRHRKHTQVDESLKAATPQVGKENNEIAFIL